ncbi:hypothetical protein SLS56_006107 [Neofusicoccum ribis]|uniref:Uncharacterized protein n=1 Tax=Neofusicoccum ribis TaxID=45134 RepID=A0ABR3SS53_9PEZI
MFCSSFIAATSVTRVSNCASPRSNASSVGIDVIRYPTPPAFSPAPDSTREWMSGETARQDGHHEAVQRVMRGRRVEAEMRRRLESSSGVRTLAAAASAVG